MGIALPIIAVGMMVGGTLMQAKAEKQASRAQAEGHEFQAIASAQNARARSDAALFNAETALANKQIAEDSAVGAIESGRVDELVSRLQTKDIIGRQTVALAANGVLLGESRSSAGDLVADTAGIGEFEALNIRFNAKQEAARFQTEAFNFGREAHLLQMESDSALRAGGLEAKAQQEAASATRKVGEKRAQSTLITGFGKAAFAGASAFGSGRSFGGGATGGAGGIAHPRGL
jgi:hypothetical protein